jgi:transposase-like protein
MGAEENSHMTGNPSDEAEMADPEVVPQAQRRRYSAGYKLRILGEADTCSRPGELGALLRREGLYSSHLWRWRREREKGKLNGLKPEKRGRKPVDKVDLRQEVEQLQRDKERLEARLAQAETIIEVQKKLSELLGLTDEASEKERPR